ncbi:hypothetical protein HYPSUDRAFT_35589 [Hypholoma sublateritium FD-334 SS-4]|uniref:Uncharacterized protein n=1 Tax=Hypholoma sublateritium (strain FD-334 SS-4) TaxID=945553 RepID=A0A0D2P7V3_HYPSF|nr:hypothetical protein HYPSUDRAFT_35589 [Hypholoma sublateritium FD-334 SS-4]
MQSPIQQIQSNTIQYDAYPRALPRRAPRPNRHTPPQPQNAPLPRPAQCDARALRSGERASIPNPRAHAPRVIRADTTCVRAPFPKS